MERATAAHKLLVVVGVHKRVAFLAVAAAAAAAVVAAAAAVVVAALAMVPAAPAGASLLRCSFDSCCMEQKR
eukprot:1147591-Pelagomonas_calceolata.AAC.2